MPTINDLGESKYLKKEDVESDKLVTIVSYDKVDLSRDNEPTKIRWVLNFKELDKPLVLNKTNGNRIAKITGQSDFDDWIGERIVLYNDEMVEFGGKLVGGIRVRAPKRQNKLTPTQQQQYDEAAGPLATDEDAEAAYDPETGKQIPF